MSTILERVADRMRAADYPAWRAKVESVRGCARPIRLSGSWAVHDEAGRLVTERRGIIFIPCGSRRAAVCPPCSQVYAADAFHIVRAGLLGGSKGVPASVTTAPSLFGTLTAPTFGAVHNRTITASGRIRPCTGCRQWHSPSDPRLGSPVDPAGYDYVGAVLWQAHLGPLWNRTTIALRRALARAAGIPVRQFSTHARLSYARVAEYQQRGLIHVHAVIRIDGPSGPTDPPPAWATVEVLAEAVTAAVAGVGVPTVRPDGQPFTVAWGTQLDIQPIHTTDETDTGGMTAARVASYVAKYATKSTTVSGGVDRPIRSMLDALARPASPHHRRMILTAWCLGELPQYAHLRLRAWSHMLAYRGHFLTKSRRYSVTFSTIRTDRRDFQATQRLQSLGVDESTATVTSRWDFIGTGYESDAEADIAHAIQKRLRRQQHHYTKGGRRHDEHD
jgi:hypothetical protein